MSEIHSHPGTEELAAFAAGDLAADGVGSHTAECAACRADVAAIERARQELAALPVIQMPVDVITAVEQALAAEAQRDRAPDDQPASLTAARDRRSGAASRLAPLAAAAAAVGLAVTFGAGMLRGGDDSSRNSAGSQVAADADMAAPEHAAARILRSGTDYDVAQLDAQIRSALTEPQTAALAAADPAAGGSAGSEAEPMAATDTRFAAAPDLTPEQLQSCVDELSGEPGSQPLLVDFATYAGEPAVVVVLPFRDGKIDVWVVRPDCRVGNDATIFFKRIDAPQP